MKNCFDRFPSVLREALESGRTKLPKDIQWEYEDMEAYRAIDTNKITSAGEITRQAFNSYAEDNPKYRNKIIGFYSCSCFLMQNSIEETKKLRDNIDNGEMKIAKGIIKCENGPIKMKNNHIDWFLFEKANPEFDFQLI